MEESLDEFADDGMEGVPRCEESELVRLEQDRLELLKRSDADGGVLVLGSSNEVLDLRQRAP